MALWTSPVADSRFEEQDEVMAVEALYPHGCTVVATEGPFMGCTGVVVGPHGPLQKGADSRGHLAAEQKKKKEQSRTVDVEFTVNPPEPPFGYALNISIMDEYVSSREASRRLGINPSVLGMITGSLVLDPIRQDIGLNLKKNGEFQLLEYARAVMSKAPMPAAGFPEPGKVGGTPSSVWTSGDTVQIVGSLDSLGSTAGAGGGNADGFSTAAGFTSWEYSEKALELIEEYRRQFPIIFIQLQQLSSQRRFTAKDIFGDVPGSGEAEVDKVLTWMKSQPFYHLARSPLSTSCISRLVTTGYLIIGYSYCSTLAVFPCMSRDGIRAIERAVDVRRSALASEEGVDGQHPQRVVKKKVPLQAIFREGMFGPYDAPLQGLNDAYGPPELGDRVVNLVASAVPFGLKGTVIAIHASSAYVEVLFDEEFAGGKSLQGLCSAFRGALVSWSSVLKVSRNTLPGSQSPKRGASQTPSYPPGRAAATHVKGQLPLPKRTSKDAAVNKGTIVAHTAPFVEGSLESDSVCVVGATSESKAVSSRKDIVSAPAEKKITGILKRNTAPVVEAGPAAADPSPSQGSRSTSPPEAKEAPQTVSSSSAQMETSKEQSRDLAASPARVGDKRQTTACGINVTAMLKRELGVAAPVAPIADQAPPTPSSSITAAVKVDDPPPAAPAAAIAATAERTRKPAQESVTAKLARAKSQMMATKAAAAAAAAITATQPPPPAPTSQKASGTASTPAATQDLDQPHSEVTEVPAAISSIPPSSNVTSPPAASAAAPPKKTAMLVPSRVVAKKHINTAKKE